MAETISVFTRIGKWFKKPDGDDNLIDPSSNGTSGGSGTSTELMPVRRPNFFSGLRVNKRDQAINNLQRGFSSLTDLMGSIKENLEQQNQRQQELAEHLSALPRVLATIPESTRLHGETLKAIHEQISNHGDQQAKLSEILEKVGETTSSQGAVLDSLHGRVEQLHEHDAKIADNLGTVGEAMQSVSKNSHTTSQVLETMRDNMSARDGELERILHRQASRFTVLLSIAIFISVMALTVVVGLGYMILYKK